jgi:bifunctional non-homologous end joining protein LigD
MARAAKKIGKHAADVVDAQLARYRSMRDFHVTAEPSGKKPPAAKAKTLPFVIQKHAASHLHYDFRLGWNGVLKSWAVAKGPSYVTRDKRLAVQVEDHPMEYGGFEGIIPQGQYGGGTVMVWDQGTWIPHGDVDEGLKKGSLKFEMHGEKMKGNWTLVRMGGKAANERKPNWLLIKEHDGFERSPSAKPITEEKPNSVVTGRSLEEIAAQEDHVWSSKKTASGKAWHRKAADLPAAKPKLTKTRSFAGELRGLPQESEPKFLPPQLAMTATTAKNGADWLHELKLDGYRIQAHISGKNREVKLLTRTGLDWTHRMRAVAHALSSLPVESAVLDGEIVVVAADGTTSFADLQAAFQDGAKKPLTYFVFDLLHLNGRNLRGLELQQRKKILAKAMEAAPAELRVSEHIAAHGEALFEKACALHAEGIISKRAAGKYVSGRSGDWLKVKCIREQEFVIGGYTPPGNGTHGIGALLLGYYEDGKLIYAGRTGTGFTQKLHRLLRERMEPLTAKASPFKNIPAEAKRGAHWVKPVLVGQIRFATWTADNLLRQASFKGLREDKPAKEVSRERVLSAPEENPASKAATKKSSAALKSAEPPVRLTHPEKILDKDSGLTKQTLAGYYWAVAPRMLPHIANRPLSLVRCPEGSGKPCFFQKHKNHMLPPGVESVDVPDKKTGKLEEYITLSTPEALAGLAQMGVLEVHPWGSKNDDLEHADRLVIDLDPDPAIPWKTLAAAALDAKKRFQQLGLESFLKTTGGKGLHVVVPIKPEHTWPIIKQFAHTFVLAMEKSRPDIYLTKMTKSARKGKIYLDYLRNDRGSTSVAPYSPRARMGANVSMPLAWSELKANKLPEFSVSAFPAWQKRLARDPWAKMPTLKQRLSKEVLGSMGIKLPR